MDEGEDGPADDRLDGQRNEQPDGWTYGGMDG